MYKENPPVYPQDVLFVNEMIDLYIRLLFAQECLKTVIEDMENIPIPCRLSRDVIEDAYGGLIDNEMNIDQVQSILNGDFSY